MQTDHFNHAPAQLFLSTGFGQFGRPSIGSWVNYGLGTPNRDLPGYVTLVTGQYPGAGNSIFGSGFLPSVYQGVEFRSQGDPVLFLSNPKGIDGNARRRTIDAINQLNQDSLADVGDPEIATRISQYEMAYRMQSSVPELMDLSMESKSTLELYGASSNGASFANNCLLARRMVERGVRFVHLFDQGWDHHGSVFKRLPSKATQVDKPIAALLTDLRQRGLLDDTLVVWGAEFGRTPMAQDDGRDHHKEGFTLWMAGGGVKGGHSIGQTDELGYKPTQSPVHVHDFNATILHLLGIDHERLTYKFQGRKFRLTDVHGHVQKQIIACWHEIAIIAVVWENSANLNLETCTPKETTSFICRNKDGNLSKVPRSSRLTVALARSTGSQVLRSEDFDNIADIRSCFALCVTEADVTLSVPSSTVSIGAKVDSLLVD